MRNHLACSQPDAAINILLSKDGDLGNILKFSHGAEA